MAAPNGVEHAPLSVLKSNPRNARTHSKQQVTRIAASIKEFGFNNPVLIDEELMILAGHGRCEAARRLNMDTVPVLRVEHLSPSQKRAYILAENQLATLAGWDNEILALELQDLADFDPEFDLTLTGFDMGEIDVLIEDLTEDEEPEPPIPDVVEGPAITQLGDIWQIGEHRLICGDATDRTTYQRLLGEASAQMVFTDPPYNVPINGHVSGLGSVRHREFAMAAGEMSEVGFQAFLATVFGHLSVVSQNGAIHYVCMDWRHMHETLAAGKEAYSELKNLCVWSKSNGGMGSLYRSQHELVFVFKSGTDPHINNVDLGGHGRNRTNVWSYAGVNGFGADRDASLAMHPTVKPVAMVRDAILDCSNRGGAILDACAGSGTTLVAAHQTGRREFGIELDPHYCDVIVRRLAELGVSATHAENGIAFDAFANSNNGGRHD